MPLFDKLLGPGLVAAVLTANIYYIYKFEPKCVPLGYNYPSIYDSLDVSLNPSESNRALMNLSRFQTT